MVGMMHRAGCWGWWGGRRFRQGHAGPQVAGSPPTNAGRARRLAAMGVLVLVAQGCVNSKPASSRQFEPLSEPARERISVLTVSATDATKSDVLDPWRKSNAMGRGAAAGAAVTIGAGLEGAGQTYGLSLLAGIVLAPAGAVVGAMAGVASAKSDAEAKVQLDAVTEVVKSVHPEHDIPSQVCTLVRTQTRIWVNSVPASAPGPALAGNATSGAVLVFTVEGYGLRGTVKHPDPDLRAFITVRGRLVDAATGLAIREQVWDREGDPRKLGAWALAGPELRGEFSRLGGDIAQAATDEFFRLVVVP